MRLRVRSHSTFFGRLLLTALVVAAPLLALRVIDFYQQRDADESRAVRQVVGHADRAAQDIDARLDRAGRLLALLAARPELQALDTPRCAPLVSSLTQLDPMLAGIRVVDLQGRPLCLAVGSPTANGSYADTGWFREAALHAEPFLSRPSQGELSRHALVDLVHPLSDPQGRAVGVLAAPIDLQALASAALATDPLPPGSSMILVAADGTILAANAEFRHWVGETAAPQEMQGTDMQTGRTFVATHRDGVQRLMAVSPLKHHGLRLACGVPTHAISARSREAFREGAFAALLALTIGLVAAVWGARRLSAPLRSLAASARAIAQGQADAVADERLPGAFGELAVAVNRMAAASKSAADASRSRERAGPSSEAKSDIPAHLQDPAMPRHAGPSPIPGPAPALPALLEPALPGPGAMLAAAASPPGEVCFELGLRNCLGRPQMYERMLRRFAEGRPSSASAIEVSLQQGDVAEGARHAHSLVSSGALIGSAHLSSLAASLETHILGSDQEAVTVLLGELKSLEAKVRAEVQEHLARSAAPAP